MPDEAPSPAQQFAADLLIRHNGDVHAALADLALLYLVARHGWCAGFDRAPPIQGSRS